MSVSASSGSVRLYLTVRGESFDCWRTPDNSHSRGGAICPHKGSLVLFDFRTDSQIAPSCLARDPDSDGLPSIRDGTCGGNLLRASTGELCRHLDRARIRNLRLRLRFRIGLVSVPDTAVASPPISEYALVVPRSRFGAEAANPGENPMTSA